LGVYKTFDFGDVGYIKFRSSVRLFQPVLSHSSSCIVAKMRSFLIPVAALLPAVLACTNPNTDACAAAFVSSSAALAGFCATYTKSAVTATTALPSAAASACEYKSKKISSACSCFITGAAVRCRSVGQIAPCSRVKANSLAANDNEYLSQSHYADHLCQDGVYDLDSQGHDHYRRW
jgi:hypothetical protein